MDARQGQVDELAFAMRERAAHEKLAQQPGRGEGQPMLPLPVSSGAVPLHHATVCPAACLPGMVIVTFHEPCPEIVTEDGTPALLSQTGCAADELSAFLAELQQRHGFQLAGEQ